MRRGAPPVFFHDTALAVENGLSEGQSLSCTFYYRVKTGLDSYGPLIFDRTQVVASGQTFRYSPERYRVAVRIKSSSIGRDIYAEMRNVSFWFPRGGVNEGVDLRPEQGIAGSILIAEQDWEAKTGSNRAITGGGVCEFSREPDTDHIEFHLLIAH